MYTIMRTSEVMLSSHSVGHNRVAGRYLQETSDWVVRPGWAGRLATDQCLSLHCVGRGAPHCC